MNKRTKSILINFAILIVVLCIVTILVCKGVSYEQDAKARRTSETVTQPTFICLEYIDGKRFEYDRLTGIVYLEQSGNYISPLGNYCYYDEEENCVRDLETDEVVFKFED